MGEWSEAINDGLICKRCFVPLIAEGETPWVFEPTLCESCEREEAAEEGKSGKIGPNWLPPRG